MTLRNFNDISAMDALKQAQLIAVGPFIFQAVSALQDLGIMKALSELSADKKLTKLDISEKTGTSLYSVSILIDLAVTADIVLQDGNGGYSLSKIGIYLSSDPMTTVNFNFSRHVCYQGLTDLTSSLKNAKPEGVKYFTKDHETIYPFLKDLPKEAKDAWFGFDHFYSDHVFPKVLPELFKLGNIKKIYDVGGNTGKFALSAVKEDPNVEVTIVDLPEQCATAASNAEKAGYSERIHTYPINLLKEDAKLPTGANIWWLSQFLDCFSEEQIRSILTRVNEAMDYDSYLAVNEICGDRQKNDIATMVIDACSLYFTALANGVSRFYHADVLMKLFQECGFEIVSIKDHIGMGHTLFLMQKSH